MSASDHRSNFIPGVGPVLFGSNNLFTIDPTKVGPASISFTQAPINVSNSGVHNDNNNFAPVRGFAYTPRFAQKIFGDHDDTVIRGVPRGFQRYLQQHPREPVPEPAQQPAYRADGGRDATPENSATAWHMTRTSH